MLSRAKGATYTSVSRVGGVHFFFWIFCSLGPRPKRGRGQRVLVKLVRWPSGTGTAEKYIAETPPRGWESKDVAALRADLERVQREKETTRADLERVQREKEAGNREYEAKLDRLRRERLVGTSFDGLGGGNSSDRRGTAASTMGPMWTRGVSTGGGLAQSLPYVPRGTVPKFPMECPPYVYIAWEKRFDVFITNQGLGHTISPDAPQIAVISCVDDAYLFGHFGEALVTEHRRTWGYICEATAGALFENRLYECHSVSDDLRTM